MERAYLGLGSNLGMREENILQAKQLIAKIPGVRVIEMSSFHETRPVGYLDQPDFINAALAIGTTLMPRQLLAAIKKIEQTMGRTETVRFGPRIIDIDILLFEDRVVDEEDLTIPHPRMHERAFVLVPLAEIAPNEIHPVLKKSVIELRNKLKGQGEGALL